MKKLVLFFVLFLSFSFVFASVSFSPDVPDDIKLIIEKAIDENDKGRDDINFSISSYSYSIDEKERIHLSFDLSFLDKSLELSVVSNNQKSLKEDINEEIVNALFYETSLYLDSDEKLDYIYSGSFSFYHKKNYRLGSSFVLKDANGKTKGFFELKRHHGEVDELQSVFISSPKPGMMLERASSWRYALYGSTNFYKKNFAFALELSTTNIIYPFLPAVTFLYENKKGTSSFYSGIGIQAYLDISDLLKNSFTFIQNGRVGASAFLLLGIRGGDFVYDGMYSIYYEHRAFAKFLWRVGYIKLPELGHSMVFGIGGSF